jgi:hypothetical protein
LVFRVVVAGLQTRAFAAPADVRRFKKCSP